MVGSLLEDYCRKENCDYFGFPIGRYERGIRRLLTEFMIFYDV